MLDIFGDYLVSLKLLSSARRDTDEDISKPLAKELPRSCLPNRDQMNMTTAVALFRKQLLDMYTLLDDPMLQNSYPNKIGIGVKILLREC